MKIAETPENTVQETGENEDTQQRQEEEEEEEEKEVVEEETPTKRKSSIAWEFFKTPNNINKNVATVVQWTLCCKKLKSGTDKKYSRPTSSMLRHLQAIHPRHLQKAKRQLELSQASTSGASTSQASAGSAATSSKNDIPTIVPQLANTETRCRKCKKVLSVGEQCVAVFLQSLSIHSC